VTKEIIFTIFEIKISIMAVENYIKDMIILYVSDQSKSRDLYKTILNKEPQLDVPGMTEFSLNENTILGLMPEKGIEKILGDKMPVPSSGNGIPRCELYLSVPDVQKAFDDLIKNGGKIISPPSNRDWGHFVAYGTDTDGHVIAFAQEKK
jgi:predicted enzyme related to lactoylglutathione lyase